MFRTVVCVTNDQLTVRCQSFELQSIAHRRSPTGIAMFVTNIGFTSNRTHHLGRYAGKLCLGRNIFVQCNVYIAVYRCHWLNGTTVVTIVVCFHIQRGRHSRRNSKCIPSSKTTVRHITDINSSTTSTCCFNFKRRGKSTATNFNASTKTATTVTGTSTDGIDVTKDWCIHDCTSGRTLTSHGWVDWTQFNRSRHRHIQHVIAGILTGWSNGGCFGGWTTRGTE